MAMEGQRDTKNTTLIPSIRTLVDSKLMGDLYRGSTSLELYRGSSLLGFMLHELKDNSYINDERGENTRLFIGLLNPNS
ncbi:hypothetical protein BHE74_00042145 [Ensete ventricosum]|nr:hypothetical protein BHE74_00042145 [Ensete ventricosum]